MKGATDKIICRGLQFECQLGFHGYEKGLKQKIQVDLAASVRPIPPEDSDKIQAIRLDYYEANRIIGRLLENRRFNLVETVAEEISKMLLAHFDVEAVEVTITKYPIDMPNAGSVSYVCRRER